MSEKKKTASMITMDMTTGPILRPLLIFAVPLFIGNIFQQLYSMVDTMVAGYTLGDGAIAAIGATSALYGLLIDFSCGLNAGCAIVVTQCFGAHDESKLRRSIAGMAELDALITCIVTVLSLVFMHPLMRFMNTPDAILEDAYSYIVIICAGMIFTTAYNMFSSVLRAVGNSRTSLYFLILSSVLNIGMDYLFVAVLGIGVAGAALATVIAQAVSATLCGIYVFRHYRSILPRRGDLKVSARLLGELLSNGTAMAMMYCLVDLGSVIFQRANNGLGEAIISAHTAARRVIVMLMQPLGTLSAACSTFAAQNWGAKKTERIRSGMRRVFLLDVAWSVFACLLAWLFGDVIIRFTTGTEDAAIIANGVLSLRWHLTFFPVLGVLLSMRGAMQAMGRKSIPIISSCAELGMKLLFAAVIIPKLGFTGTCMTEPLTWTLMFLILAAAYIKYDRAK